MNFLSDLLFGYLEDWKREDYYLQDIRKNLMRIKHVIAMAAVHNLRVCMAITFIIWIYSTNPNLFKKL